RAKALKYGLLHTFSGVLLVLKERLRREHPSLIFSKVHLSGPEHQTVNFDELLQRLESIAAIKLTASDKELLRRAQGARNRIEHYEVALDLDETKKLIGDLIEFIFRFMRSELDTKLEEHLPQQSWRRIQELRDIAHQLHEEDERRWRELAKPYFKLGSSELEQLRLEHEGGPREG